MRGSKQLQMVRDNTSKTYEDSTYVIACFAKIRISYIFSAYNCVFKIAYLEIMLAYAKIRISSLFTHLRICNRY